MAIKGKRSGAVLLAVALAGCSAVREARDAQEAAEGKARDDRVLRTDLTKPEAGSPAVSFALPDCVGYALTNRPSVIAAQLEVRDARLALKEIAADAPLVSTTPWNAFEASASASWSETSEAQTYREIDGRTQGENPSASLSVDILVYDFGRNAADARAQAERVIASEQSLIDENYAVFQEVANASFTCREVLALLAAAETNELAFLLRLRQVESQLAAGEAKNLDVARAKLDYATSCETLLSASNAVRTAFAEFRHALGIPADLICPEADLGAVLSKESLLFPYADPIALARTNAPSMRIARARLRAASADVDRAVADLYPTLSASVSASWTDPLWIFAWGGRAAQSLFEGFRRQTAVRRATVALKKAEADVEKAEQDLMQYLELAMATRANSREQERAARKSLVAAEENLAVVSEQCKLGEADRIELTDAINSVAEARGSIATAVCAGQKAEAALFVLTGTAPVYVAPTQEVRK